ncbi:unnamed protein product [Anisakis simplex]|uniref:Uncharacterized protein n=2 Tax=Anisakis simplex TaxID=6269 RepID=A0A0M3J8S3_ANISI|nr:unnamed protein product [Anisakis simplex]
MLTSNRRGRMEESVCSARDGDLVNISISRIVADFFIMLCCGEWRVSNGKFYFFHFSFFHFRFFRNFFKIFIEM